jgi:hypothetical protein
MSQNDSKSGCRERYTVSASATAGMRQRQLLSVSIIVVSIRLILLTEPYAYADHLSQCSIIILETPLYALKDETSTTM